MRFFEDIDGARDLIEEAIKKFGYAAEHNFFWYKYYFDPGCRNIFVEGEHGFLFTSYNERKQSYYIVFDPLAHPEHRASLLLEYIIWVFSNPSAKKVWFQIETPVRKQLLRILPERYRAHRNYFTLTWPIYDLQKFDPTLPGGHYKTLRKEYHRFYREHEVAVRDVKTYEDLGRLHTIVDDWKKKRPNPENASEAQYHHIIDGRFEGTDEARIFIVDGVVRGFNAGWMTPNSDCFYGAVGIHDYSMEDLGDMLYLEDLFWLKAHGYRKVDMAGSEKPLLAFKNKFCAPERTYQTSHFSAIVLQ